MFLKARWILKYSEINFFIIVYLLRQNLFARSCIIRALLEENAFYDIQLIYFLIKGTEHLPGYWPVYNDKIKSNSIPFSICLGRSCEGTNKSAKRSSRIQHPTTII